MKRKIIALILLLSLAFTGCRKKVDDNRPDENRPGDNITTDDSSYGKDLEDLGAMDGYFEGERQDISVRCVEGTPGAYKLEGNVLKFTSLSSDSVYAVSGKLSGSIIIDIGDSYKLELELSGLSLGSSETSPITVISGNKVTIQAKKGTQNFIYDTRATISNDDADAHSGAIFSAVDLEVSGKGKLSLVSENNSGIHSKKDLEVKNLTLIASSADTTLKGNDSLALENATATVISIVGDCLKTSNSDISNKGNQRGSVTISGGGYEIYSACDGIDAAYNVEIADGTDVKIYTDKYSNYSKEGTAVGGFNDGNGDKGDRSTKGIKAANEIIINGGSISIKAYDDAIHSSNDATLENGESPKGNLTINGGNLTIHSNDNGLYADGTLTMNGGNISVINSYEGVEGYTVKLLGGRLSVISKDDGINATATSGTSITIGGGDLYVFAGGDGIDSNSRTSYSGIAFTGGRSIIISTSGGNSAIDSEQGYSYSGGSHVAIMPCGGMSGESTHCQNFQSIGKKTELSLTKGQCVSIKIGSDKLTLNMPASLSALVITLGDIGASVTTSASDSSLSEGEYSWN